MKDHLTRIDADLSAWRPGQANEFPTASFELPFSMITPRQAVTWSKSSTQTEELATYAAALANPDLERRYLRSKWFLCGVVTVRHVTVNSSPHDKRQICSLCEHPGQTGHQHRADRLDYDPERNVWRTAVYDVGELDDNDDPAESKPTTRQSRSAKTRPTTKTLKASHPTAGTRISSARSCIFVVQRRKRPPEEISGSFQSAAAPRRNPAARSPPGRAPTSPAWPCPAAPAPAARDRAGHGEAARRPGRLT
jgi:hypothetical protein